MKQLLQFMRDGRTEVADVPVPQVRPGMVLVRTVASLVSAGTERMVVEFAEKSLVGKARSRPDLVRQMVDKARREGVLTALSSAFNRLDQPMTLGYSSAGIVLEVGAGVTDFKPGDRVACAGGGYAVHAEYVVVPQRLVTHLPDEVSFEAGAFTTLGAIALHGLRLANPQVGEQVAVIGLGLLGLLAVQLAQAAGCTVFGVDLSQQRVELARKLGANAALRGQAEESGLAFSQGRGFDAVLICADTPANDPVELAATLCRDRGVVVAVGAVGLKLPRKPYYDKEIDFRISRSYGPGRYDPAYEERGRDYPIGYVRWTEGRNFEAVVALMATGRLDVLPLISHRFPIEQAVQAYQLITGKRGEPFLGVLLTYSQDDIILQRLVINPAVQSVTAVRGGLGVLGAGNYASAVFLPAVQRVGGLERVMIASASGVTARHAMQRFGFGFASSDEQQVLQDERVGVVAILTRHNHHARQVLSALHLGKAVFCEKPLALNEEELAEIERELSKPGVPLLMVGFNRRFAPFSQRLKAFFEGRREALFLDYRVNAGYLPATHWLHDAQQGGGRIIGEGCHFIDFATFLVGQVPQRVWAQALPDGERYHEDNVVLNFAFADGSLATISYLANGDKSYPKEQLNVFCGGRVAALDDFRMLELVGEGRRTVLRSPLRQDKGHEAGWRAFVQVCQAGGLPPIPYAHLLGVTRASFAAVQALRSGQVVEIGPATV